MNGMTGVTIEYYVSLVEVKICLINVDSYQVEKEVMFERNGCASFCT